MPWTASDAQRHTRKAKTSKQKRQWAHVAESMRKRGASEGAAMRAANGVIAKGGRRKKSGRKRSRG